MGRAKEVEATPSVKRKRRVVENEKKLLTRQAVLDRVSMGKSKLYEMMKEGDFPKPHRIEPGMLRWRVEEVDAWINRRAPVAA